MPTPIFQPYAPGINDTADGKIKGLYNAYIDTTQQLQWLLSHLDEKNVVRAKAVVADWVYAGNVKATQIDTTTAKIQSAQIETLVVGGNVQIGSAQTAAGVTTIIGNTVTTGYVSALGLVVGTNVGQGTAPRVFTTQPAPPYSVGDLWTNGSDLRRCVASRATGVYNTADWGLATNYTSPTGVTTIVGGMITTDYISALGLMVGTHIAMGPSATISWDKVTNQPYIPPPVTLPSYIKSTYIDSTTVMSPHISGGTISGSIINVYDTVVINPAGAGGINFVGASIYRYPSGSLFIESSTNMQIQPQGTTSIMGSEFVCFAGRFGVFGSSTYKQSAQLLPEDGSSTIRNIEVKINGILQKLSLYGLFDVYY